MENDLISVVIPVYQAKKSIGKCIESILMQTYNNLQIIVIDDGSTDDSGKICESYKTIDSRIEVIHTVNSGSVAARAEGLRRAKGAYIGFVDADDYIKPRMFEILYDAIKNSNADFVHSWFESESAGRIINEVIPYRDDFHICNLEKREEVFKKLFIDDKTKLTPSMWSKLYKAEFIKRNFEYLPERQCFGEDYILLFCCLSNCSMVRVIENAEYVYVIREKSLSHLNDNEWLQSSVNLFSAIVRINEDFEHPISKDLLNVWLRKEMESILQNTCIYTRRIGGLRYHIENIEKYRNKKIVLYGAGNVGLDYLYQMNECHMDKPVAIVDKVKRKLIWDDIDVFQPDSISTLEYDIILIAVYKEMTAFEIKKELIKLGVPAKMIAWEHPQR